ncbi:acyltransferase family protein [Mycobacterium sp. Marseille-P9652]|uniref:acyltransferase family protein n=1 Tax=Mycobacterium sp. Marseille-P9652 TaxID=2654950 RepID=UPI0018CFF549|nr:acyltransferase [Mycobacterium sp. Marseille-P9652]
MTRDKVPGRATKPERDASVDVARGIAIVSVVLVHVLRGLDAAHLLGRGDWFPAMDRVLSLWGLSVFAFLGGVFVRDAVAKRSLPAYLYERSFRLIFVYVLWSQLQGVIQIWAAGIVNHPGSVGFLLELWAPKGQLWYLPFLVLATLVLVPMRPWRSTRGPWILAASAILSVAFWGLDDGVIGTQGLGLVVFFVGGMVCGVRRLRSALASLPSLAAGLAGGGLFSAGVAVAVHLRPTPPTTCWSERTVSTVALGVALSVLMSFAVLLCARGEWASLFLGLCGRRSLDIFLIHIVMASGSRIVLVKLGVQSTATLVAVGLIAGVAGSLLAASALRRAGLGWVFDGPTPPAFGRSRSRRP